MKTRIWTIALLVFACFGAVAQVKKKPVAAKPKPPVVSPLAASMARGKVVYGQICITCHMADGGGVMSMNPPLTGTEYVLGDKTRLINIVLKGFNEEVEIDGDLYSNPMPPLPHLTDAQIADVLTYVRNSFKNKATAVTAAEVKAVRAAK